MMFLYTVCVFVENPHQHSAYLSLLFTIRYIY